MKIFQYLAVFFLFVSCCNPKSEPPTGGNEEKDTTQTIKDTTQIICESHSTFVAATVLPEQLHFMWSGVSGTPATFAMVKDSLPDGQKLIFACNGGMYTTDYRPVGLFAKDGTTLKKMSPPGNGTGNYSLGFGNEKVNGIFAIDKQGRASILKSLSYQQAKSSIQQATQSGPLLLWKGEINPNFKEGSTNRLLRNGVGIRPDGNVVFIMAKDICFYDFAALFRDKYHCQNALYFDGVVSKTYLPAKGLEDLTGEFGVVIYVTDKK